MISTFGVFGRCSREFFRSFVRLGYVGKRSCYSLFEDHAHGLRFLGRHNARKKIERLLASGAIEIDFTNYIESGLLDKGCPVRKIYVNQLAANSPLEDRWNVGFTQVRKFIVHPQCYFSSYCFRLSLVLVVKRFVIINTIETRKTCF